MLIFKWLCSASIWVSQKSDVMWTVLYIIPYSCEGIAALVSTSFKTPSWRNFMVFIAKPWNLELRLPPCISKRGWALSLVLFWDFGVSPQLDGKCFPWRAGRQVSGQHQAVILAQAMVLCLPERARLLLVAKSCFHLWALKLPEMGSRTVSHEMQSSSFSSHRDCMHVSCVGVWFQFYPSFSAADTHSLGCLVSKNNEFDALRLLIITLDQINSRELAEEVVGSGANPSVSDKHKSPYFQMHFYVSVSVCMHAPMKQYIISTLFSFSMISEGWLTQVDLCTRSVFSECS